MNYNKIWYVHDIRTTLVYKNWLRNKEMFSLRGSFFVFYYIKFSQYSKINCVFFQIQRELLSWINPAVSRSCPSESQYYVRTITFHCPLPRPWDVGKIWVFEYANYSSLCSVLDAVLLYKLAQESACFCDVLVAICSGDIPMHFCWCNSYSVFKCWYYENVMWLGLDRCLKQTTHHIYFAASQNRQTLG